MNRTQYFSLAIALVIVALLAFRFMDIREANHDAQAISRLEGQAHQAWKEIRADAGGAWDLGDAERVEREVLPRWREARRLVEEARSGPHAAEFPPEMEEFFRLREESWQALIASVRERDRELFDRHVTLFEEAEQIGAQIKQRQDGSGDG